MSEFESPEVPGKVLANGHIYKVYFVAGEERPTDIQIARALQPLGAVKIEHITDGGTNAIVTPTIKKENA